jgi:hypothetical protein
MKTIPITFRVPEQQYEYLKESARIRSIKENKDISVSDLAREAISYLPPMFASGCNIVSWANNHTSGTVYCYP